MRLAALLLVFVWVHAVAGTAVAQRQGPRHDEASTRLASGTVLFNNGNYDGAIAEFEASYALEPDALIRLNIGQCHRQLARYDEAIAEYRRYLAEATDATRERRAQVERTIRDLEGVVATVSVEVRPMGATVRVDGRTIGAAPLTAPLRLGAGRRVLEVSADGYRTSTQDLMVAGGESRTVTVELAPADTGMIHVASEPGGAIVHIDGSERGPTPVELVLQSGGHVIEARLEGFRAYRQAVTLAPQQDLRLQIQLEQDTGHDVVGEPWLWILVGAGVVGLGVGATFLGIWLTPPQPDCGTLGPCATATLP